MLAIVALCSGCPRRTEGTADASAGRPAEEQTTRPVEEAPAPQGPSDAGGPLAGGTADAGGPEGAAAGGEEACVDRWLEGRGMDRYGSPRGTMYMGGTPLFNEATGERTDRLVYVYQKHPEARAACGRDGGSAAAPSGPVRQ